MISQLESVPSNHLLCRTVRLISIVTQLIICSIYAQVLVTTKQATKSHYVSYTWHPDSKLTWLPHYHDTTPILKLTPNTYNIRPRWIWNLRRSTVNSRVTLRMKHVTYRSIVQDSQALVYKFPHPNDELVDWTVIEQHTGSSTIHRRIHPMVR